jgi:hypothetical protein
MKNVQVFGQHINFALVRAYDQPTAKRQKRAINRLVHEHRALRLRTTKAGTPMTRNVAHRVVRSMVAKPQD